MAPVRHCAYDLCRTASQLSQAGTIVGTPAFMAPEQATGEPVDVRCDLFSLGSVLYRAATGELPFPGKNSLEILHALAVALPRPARDVNVDIPPALSELLARLLAKAPAARPTSAQSVVDAIRSMEQELLAGQRPPCATTMPARTRPTNANRWVVLTAVACLLAGILFAGSVFHFQTRHGTLIVTTMEPDLQVFIDGEEKTLVVDSKKVGRVELLPGEHSFVMKRGQEELLTTAFTLRHGGEVILHARWQPKVADAKKPLPVPEGKAPPTPVGKDALVSDAANEIGWKWFEDVAQLSAEDQIAVVRAKLKERNRGFDGKGTYDVDGGKVVAIGLAGDELFDLSPLRVFAGMRKFSCRGSGQFKRDLVHDLSPLQGMKLTELDCEFTGVTNLKPLQNMPLRKLTYTYRSWLAAAPLRSITTLETINGQPAAAFWKKVDAEAEDFERFRKHLAVLPWKDQWARLDDKLKERNPNFTGITQPPKIDNGAITELIVPTPDVVDISPVRALPDLRVLNLFNGYKGKVADLSPLEGMKLTSLNLGGCVEVRDLSPLKGMPLTTLILERSHVRDLTPLRGMALTTLDIRNCPMRNLAPLQGMPLTSLNMHDCLEITDLAPLRDARLTSLNISSCFKLRDLEPLCRMRLTTLNMVACPNVYDVTPLANMPLEEFSFRPEDITRGIDVIRSMKSLKRISVDAQALKFLTPAEFWKK